jgi:hypothetical protein
MKYATWKLNFADPMYGTGPEDAIVASGKTAQGALADGDITQGATILGYVSSAVKESELTAWSVKNLSSEEALAFAKTINSTAYFTADGLIAIDNLEEPS